MTPARCPSFETRRHGGHAGAVPSQMTACAPPNENFALQVRTVPQRILQARGYWSANPGPNWCFLWTDTEFHDVFRMKTFFLGDHLFSAGKTA